MGYALVTGASKGIGKAIAEELAKRKYDVLLVARSQDLLIETAAAITKQFAVKADYLAIDLAQPAAAAELYAWCIKNNFTIEILVNNAGYGLSGPFGKYNDEEYTAMMQVNMNTLVSLCHYFLPGMKKLQQAFVLNIASTAAYQPVPGLALYAASKSFVVSFSRALSYELRNTTVSVTCACPGSTDTDFVNRASMSSKTKKTALKFNMAPAVVALIAVNAMFKRKTEIIVGSVNKLGAFLAWLLPKRMVEKNIASIYDMN